MNTGREGRHHARSRQETDVAADRPSTGATPFPLHRGRLRRLVRALGPDRVSVLYLGGALLLVFAFWVPETFFRMSTVKSTLAEFSVVGIVTLGLVIALVAGAFDLSVGATLGLSAMVVATLLPEGSQTSPMVAISLALAVGVCTGVVNGLLVAKMHINSLIATLGVSSVLSAIVVVVSDNLQRFGLSDSVTGLAGTGPFGIAWPVYYLLALGGGIWFMLQHTPAGRYLYATGGNPDAARLAGVRTERTVFLALLASAVLASVAGIVLAARINGATPTIGSAYLLPAFAAAFLGSTQISPGRHNVWGTMLAIGVLGFGTKGFDLGGVDFWVRDLFYGLALIFAISLATIQARVADRRRRRQALVEYKAEMTELEDAAATV